MPIRPAARRSSNAFLAAVLALLAGALLAPALASAATYTVNSAFDEEKGVGFNCGVAETCTLRAALELSNESTSVRDTIDFSAAFDGEVATDTIQQFLVNFPAIEDDVTIDGGEPCETDAQVEGPCVGLEGPDGLEVLADDVTIEGLAITSALAAICVCESNRFTARGNWIGVPLDGGTTANNLDGIVLGPGSDEATIGGTTEAARNVFAHNNGRGLALEGASKATVEGNYFGVGPDGTTVGENEEDLVITDHVSGGPPVTVPAAENTIGADVGANGAKTDACDFGCNVFASALPAAGIDLLGLGGPEEASASGPTEIEGNYVGLDAEGEALANAPNVGIRVGTAPKTTIGGLNPGQANHINGSGFAIRSGNGGLPAKKLVVEGNLIGRSPDGTAALAPAFMGMEIASAGIAGTADQARLIGNSISATDTGILQYGTGAVIEGNEISGGEFGIVTNGSTKVAGLGNEILGNTLLESEENGIWLQNDGNKVFDNEVIDAGGSAIIVDPETEANISGNVIGGDSDSEENTILDSGEAAILIRGIEASRNEVGRNHGSGNGQAFITLRPFGGGPDPNGIKRPTISIAGKTEATGKGVPGAVVRVFFKASEEEGELGGFLGEAAADINGDWKVAYEAPVPGETLVTATQTKAGGTSDLAETVKTPPDPPTPTCATDPALCPPKTNPPASTPPPPAPSKPKVTIAKGPKAKSTSTSATFKFSADVAGSGFSCKLDGKAFAKCRSPKTYKNAEARQARLQGARRRPGGQCQCGPSRRQVRSS